MSVFIGVDGGGSHARALLVDEEGRELARQAGTAGLVDPREPTGSADVVARLARAVLDAAGVDAPADALCCGLAGAGRMQEREAVRVALALARVAEHIIVIGDAEAAMSDAFGTADGILLIAGTGSIAWARSGADVLRVGGWGTLLGDEGSGYDIGLRALRAVARAHDGREPDTALTSAILAHCAVDEPPDLIAWAARAAKAEIAALAPLVMMAADGADAAAVYIRTHAVSELVTLAVIAAQRVRLSAPHIVTAGGLVADASFRALLHDALRARIADAHVDERSIDAARGAALIARQSVPRR